jgi:flagellar basal-body rod modification protein FlgD
MPNPMNALVGFRNNVSGVLSPSAEQRRKAMEEVWSMARTTAAARSGNVLKANTAEAGERVVNNELDRDAFLTLLVEQMQYQDPMNPVSNEDMIAQLAQFSSLEQMSNLNDSFEAFSGNFENVAAALTQNNLVSASTLLGRTVTGTAEDGTSVTGAVSRVFAADGGVFLEVNEQRIPVQNLTEVV